MIRSSFLRAVLITALGGGVWLILAGWSTDSPRDRFVEATISVLVLFLAIGVALPDRAFWALRLVAGAVGIGYLAYFGSELWALVQGQEQTLRVGEPSVWLAGLGLLIIGLPMLLFASGGNGSRFLQYVLRHGRGRSADDPRNTQGPAA